MTPLRIGMVVAIFLGYCTSLHTARAQTTDPIGKCKIVLVAGETAKIDTIGHHDYIAGCKCLEVLLHQTAGIETVQVQDGWPQDQSVFDGAKSIVFYTDGGGKQVFLNSQQRIEKVQSLVDSGVGIVMIHQAVDFPNEFAERAKSWLGGIYLAGESGRGHWDSKHVDFPSHPTTRGVTPWEINDGWLNKIRFLDELRGVTPLVWSGKKYAGSRAGLNDDIVAWAYERPGGGRSFSFTGLDAHAAWSLAGLRQFIVNGVLWSAGADIPKDGASCKVDEVALAAMQTPREPKPAAAKSK